MGDSLQDAAKEAAEDEQEEQQKIEMEAMWRHLQNAAAQEEPERSNYPTDIGRRRRGEPMSGYRQEERPNPYPLRRVQGTVQGEPGTHGWTTPVFEGGS